MSDYKLLPCPFCGGRAYLEKSHRAFIGAVTKNVTFVRCQNCEARTGRVNIEDYGRTSHSKDAEMAAVNAWNTRAQLSRQNGE